jgi:hypothetical protein
MTYTSYLDTMQGKSEHHTELYISYSEGVAQLLTQQSAKSNRGVLSFAQKQAVTLWRVGW